jgi:hypothetical protein
MKLTGLTILFFLLVGTCNQTNIKKEFKVLDMALPALDPTLDCGASLRYKNSLYEGNYQLSFNVKIVYFKSMFDLTDSLEVLVESTLNDKFKSEGIFFDVTKKDVSRLTEFNIRNFNKDADKYDEKGYITIILYDDKNDAFNGIAKEIPSTIIGVQKSVLNDRQTLTHEMGHALGLKHIFEKDHTDGYNLTYGDNICDTPSFNIMDLSTHQCVHKAPHKYTEEELSVIIPNYLNYSFEKDDCRKSFTPQQSLSMRWHIENFPTLYNALQ